MSEAAVTSDHNGIDNDDSDRGDAVPYGHRDAILTVTIIMMTTTMMMLVMMAMFLTVTMMLYGW